MTKKLSLNTQILYGAIIGIVVGIILNNLGNLHPIYGPTIYISKIVGKGIFLNLLKMILIPLVFTSIAVGIANLRAHAQMDRVWKLSMLYYIGTTALSIILGLIVVNIFKPGLGLEIETLKAAMASSTNNPIAMTLPQFAENFIFNLFQNPIAAMASGNILPTIIFAIFIGIAIVMAGEKAKVFIGFLNDFFELIMIIVGWIMRILPFGLMALLIELIASQDLVIFLALGKFMLVVIGATLFHGLITLPLVLVLITKSNPVVFFRGIREALITAVSTSSSSATLPITLRCVKDKLNVDKDVAGFVLPLGATINMDGTALYEAVAALFVANLVGIELNIIQQMIVFFAAMVAAIGAPGIPSAGLVTLMVVFQSVGLPVEAIAILIPIDRPLDALRTAVNVEGDTIGCMVVQKFTPKK